MHETPLFQSATDAAQAVRRKELSSRELTEMLLARIEEVNPPLNAVVELRREAALREAAATDEAAARGDAGPLHGVPMTIKDSFNVTELHTTWGNPAFKDFVADSDTTVVRRLRQAGAIIVGKTNVAFMLGDFGQTANELYGVTNNPWDTTRTPGASSGGTATAPLPAGGFSCRGRPRPRRCPRIQRGLRAAVQCRGHTRPRLRDGSRGLA
jgi:amidase